MAIKKRPLPVQIRFTPVERELLREEATRRGITRHRLIRELSLAAIQLPDRAA
jgi:hypothetical protein